MADFKLTGKRIILRPLRKTDAQDIYKNIQDKRIAKYTLHVPWPYTLKHAHQFIEKSQEHRKKQTEYTWGIELNKEIVGVISLMRISHEHQKAEMGYWLGKGCRSKGIMTEAGKLVLKFGFKKMKLNKIYAFTFTDNPCSKRVMQKLKMKQEGLMRADVKRHGKFRDDLYFGILKKEFK